MRNLVSVAKGEVPADLIIANAKIVNTFTAEIEQGNIAISGDRIAGIGDYHQAKETVDLGGKYVIPGLINGHIHVESSMLDMDQYAQAVVPRGTSAIVTDLHEIANVRGLEGMKYMLDIAEHLPIDVFLMVPSCVPATPLETSGAKITAEMVRDILEWKNAIGLGEMMNFPGVLFGDEEVLRKLSLAGERVIDGHAPGLEGMNLNAYIAAGPGSDHESTTMEEGREKLRRGMHLMIREGSSEKNLEALIPLVNDNTYHRCLFVVDDRSCSDLLRDGDIDAVVRKAIRKGLDPIRAIQLATINPARYFRLNGLGAIAPGYFANFLVVSNMMDIDVGMVFYRGQMVAKEGKPLFSFSSPAGGGIKDTVNIKPFDVTDLRLSADRSACPIIEVVPGQIITRKIYEIAKTEDGCIIADTERDILKLVTVERHNATGNIGKGLVKGFGLARGAMATSIAHDSHNIVGVGTNDEDIYAAIKEIERLQGGLVIVAEGRILDALPLPIAGLLSDQPLHAVVDELESLQRTASSIGCQLEAPFAVLSFLALPVIPELRLTDLGLVDVVEFKLLS